jgi:hypothetical protein
MNPSSSLIALGLFANLAFCISPIGFANAQDSGKKVILSPSAPGITLDFHVMRHLCDMEALVTYEAPLRFRRLLLGVTSPGKVRSDKDHRSPQPDFVRPQISRSGRLWRAVRPARVAAGRNLRHNGGQRKRGSSG